MKEFGQIFFRWCTQQDSRSLFSQALCRQPSCSLLPTTTTSQISLFSLIKPAPFMLPPRLPFQPVSRPHPPFLERQAWQQSCVPPAACLLHLRAKPPTAADWCRTGVSRPDLKGIWLRLRKARKNSAQSGKKKGDFLI